jgi:hypothetical protein
VTILWISLPSAHRRRPRRLSHALRRSAGVRHIEPHAESSRDWVHRSTIEQIGADGAAAIDLGQVATLIVPAEVSWAKAAEPPSLAPRAREQASDTLIKGAPATLSCGKQVAILIRGAGCREPRAAGSEQNRGSDWRQGVR